MSIDKPKYEQFYWILLWLGVSALSWYFVYLKYLALDFHTRDYAFYTEFIIKWGGPVQEQKYSMNPGGYNFLGVNTVDGCEGFYQWVHFEPIRFVQAFIYKIFHSLQAVFAFNALLVCSPIIAISLWLKKIPTGFWEKMVWVLFFILCPATLLTAGYDNRPSMFLGVGYFWLLYFLLGTKNKWGQYISFLFVFAIREEAMILNGVVCIYLFFKWRRREVSADKFLLYLITLIAYTIGLLTYFDYWNYKLFDDSSNKYSLIILIPAGIIGLTLMLFTLFKRKYNLLLFAPLLLFVVQFITMYMSNTFPDEKFSIYSDPRILMVFLMILSWMLHKRNENGKLIYYFVMIVIPVFLGVALFANGGLISISSVYKTAKLDAEPVFQILDQINEDDRIMTDYKTHQAFIEKRNLFCMDRLPCYWDKSYARFWPENFNKVAYEIGTYTDWLVIEKSRMTELWSFGKIDTIFENKFVGIKKFRGN